MKWYIQWILRMETIRIVYCIPLWLLTHIASICHNYTSACGFIKLIRTQSRPYTDMLINKKSRKRVVFLKLWSQLYKPRRKTQHYVKFNDINIQVIVHIYNILSCTHIKVHVALNNEIQQGYTIRLLFPSVWRYLAKSKIDLVFK